MAIYDSTGKLIDFKKETLTTEDNSGSLEFDADGSYIGYTAKAFYWNSTKSLKPLANSVETIITADSPVG